MVEPSLRHHDVRRGKDRSGSPTDLPQLQDLRLAGGDRSHLARNTMLCIIGGLPEAVPLGRVAARCGARTTREIGTHRIRRPGADGGCLAARGAPDALAQEHS